MNLSKVNFCLLIVLALSLFPFILSAQESTKISGQVLDVKDSSPLTGANIFWENDLKSGVVSDLDGNFEIQPTKLPARLIVSFIGYEKSIRVLT